MEQPALRVRFRDEATIAVFRDAVARAFAELPDLDRVEVDVDNGDLVAWDESEEAPLFVEDTTPEVVDRSSVPSYNRKFDLLTAEETPPDNPEVPRPISAAECFNCSGNHLIKDCPYPKNVEKINQRRKEMKNKSIRYHAEEQMDGDATPGKLSSELRRALGLNKNQLPLHIYRMRLLGYPPGWLLNAKVAHSGITMFDSQGKEMRDGDDKKQSCPTDEYNVDKIMEFPGFNVPMGNKYIDESHLLGYPQYNELHSKMMMLEALAPIAAKAYRRKKMAVVRPEGQPGDMSQQTDMEIVDEESDKINGDTENLIPPLPSYSPPPDRLPPPPTADDSSQTDLQNSDSQSSMDKVTDNEFTSHCNSPSLTELESQKLILLAALEEKDTESAAEESQCSKTGEDGTADDKATLLDETASNHDSEVSFGSQPCTPRQGGVLVSNLGTPLYNLSGFSDLPSNDSFSKDICEVLNFENLPNSTGKYVQMAQLIKKIRHSKTQLDQDQE